MRIKQLCLTLSFCLFTLQSFASIYFIPRPYNSLPGWQNSSISPNIFNAIKASCQRNLTLYPYYFQPMDIRGQLPWLISCEAVLRVPDDASPFTMKATIETYFQPYLVVHNYSATGLFTGYYLPEIQGSLTETSYFNVPIYGMPKKTWDMPTREDISTMTTIPNTPILAWIHSSVDRYFMQIQGSGLIVFPNGNKILLGYAGQNGYPYYPVGRFLHDINAAKPTGGSNATIEDWFNQHGTWGLQIIDIDPSFVFFKVLATSQPLGAEKIELTPGHSLAVDTNYIPLGTPIWLSTFYPDPHNPILHAASFNRMVIAQDTGGAIKGPIRGDIYWGSGTEAFFLASHLQSPGQYWTLLPTGLNIGILDDQDSQSEF